jgi:HD-GYP domain-containing protein (c-di-GMP phosphodiesterase class II)
MPGFFRRWLPQPATAIAFMVIAVAAVVWTASLPQFTLQGRIGLESVFLVITLSAGLIWAGLFPIHINRQTKLQLTTIPLYLMAVLLPPAVASLTAGTVALVSQLVSRSRTGNLPSDIATNVGRWTLIVLLSSLTAHLSLDLSWREPVVLCAAAIVLYLTDVFTSAFEVGAMWGEPPLTIIPIIARISFTIETVQYLLAILGALAIEHQVWAVLLLIVPSLVIHRAFKQSRELQDSTRLLLEGMADAIDLRDSNTGGHSRRVADSCARILKALDITGAEAELIVSAARVHDIGKIAVPDSILNKPGKLTPDERVIMESHSERGAQLLARYSDFARGRAIVLHHHERWDGNGYPQQIKEYEIPLGARIIAVADSFDAMTNDRPYRHGMSVEQACHILVQERGRQFDSKIVDAFLGQMQSSPETPETPAVPLPTLASDSPLPAS